MHKWTTENRQLRIQIKPEEEIWKQSGESLQVLEIPKRNKHAFDTASPCWP